MTTIKNPLVVVQKGGGGGGGGDYSDEVRFIDYDGTIITQMSIAEANQLTAMPDFPVHEDLTALAWTAVLEEVQTTTKPLDVGVLYINSHDPTQTMIKFYPTQNQQITISFYQNVANGAIVNWGDGSPTQTTSSTGQVTMMHTYNSVNAANCPYKITMTPSSSTASIKLGYNQSHTFWNENSSTANYNKFEVIMGQKMAFKPYAFANCRGLTSVVIPGDFTYYNIDSHAFEMTQSLKAIVLPVYPYTDNTFNGSGIREAVLPHVKNFSIIPNSYFKSCAGLRRIVIPETVTNAGGYTFQYCAKLTDVVLPDGLTTIGPSFADSATQLGNLTIPSGATPGYGFVSSCPSLRKVIFKNRASLPSSSYLFTDSATGTSPTILDFTDFSQVPTIDANTFSGIPAYTQILVPKSLESSWKTAANWANYASQIIGV